MEKVIRGFKWQLVIFVIALLISGGLFYWYEYRPGVIRAKCSAEAEKLSAKDEFVYEIIYRHCLRNQGIESPEQKE
jgi:hypothetical protein